MISEAQNEGVRKQPTLIYDGDCPVCRKIVAILNRCSKKPIHMLSYQSELKVRKYPKVDPSRMKNYVQWIDELGGIFEAGSASLKAVQYVWPSTRRLLSFMKYIPGTQFIIEKAYKYLSNKRFQISKYFRLSDSTAPEFKPDISGGG